MKDRRLRMIWNSNAVFVPSGYGVHQKDILYRFLKDGWETAQIANAGLEVSPITLDGLKIYPRMGDQWGGDAMIHHGLDFRADVVFSMQDVWTLQPQFLQQVRNWIPYIPIDKEPVPQNVLAVLPYARKIVTFSRFGQKALLKAGFYSTLIPEGVDTNILKPLDKIEAKKKLNLPLDKFIFGQIGANKPDGVSRKGWQQSLDAFALFYALHPESIYFCESNQPGGFPIMEYARHLNIEKQIFFLPEYISMTNTDRGNINLLYNAFDALLHPSSTEGFGLCIVESQAAGTPVIINNCTSMPELILPGKTGEMCEPITKLWAPGGGYVYLADPKSLFAKMEVLYKKVKADNEAIRKACRQHVVEKYNVDTTVPALWTPFLENLQEELLGAVDKGEKKT